MDRRNFLRTAAGSSVAIFGLRELLSRDGEAPQERDPKGPEWYRAALAEMKASKRPGVVIVVPDKWDDAKPFGQAILDNLDGWQLRMRIEAGEIDPLHEVVLLCMPTSLRQELLPGEGNRVLLSSSGRRVVTDTVSVEELDERFHVSLRRFVHGDSGEHLRGFVATARAALSPEDRDAVDAALKALPRGGTVADAGQRVLETHSRTISTLLASALQQTSDAAVKKRLKATLGKGAVSAIPFGATLPNFTNVCGFYRELEKGKEDEGLRIACGMARPTKAARRYLRFLTS